jgi:hypothetical protein
MESQPVSLGPDVEGYSLRGAAGQEYVLYARTPTPQPVKVHFMGLDHPFELMLNGTTKNLPTKRGETDLLIGPQPVVLGGISAFPVPDGAIDAESADITRLMKIGTDAHAPMDSWDSKLSYIRDNPLITGPDGSPTEFGMLAGLDAEIRNVVCPYIWIEAESPSAQTGAFSLESQDTSDGAYLWLDGKSIGDSGPSADYPFGCSIPGDYDIWASVGPTSASGVYEGAPITVSFDDGAPLSSVDARPTGNTYGTVANLEQNVSGGFVWERLTSVTLTAGQHVMHIMVSGSSEATGRASVAIDCFCLDRDAFDPNGVAKPKF